VLLIAGTGQQLIDWPTELVEQLLERGYRVIIFDNRDSGLSTKFTAAGLPDSAAIAKALQEGKVAPPYRQTSGPASSPATFVELMAPARRSRRVGIL